MNPFYYLLQSNPRFTCKSQYIGTDWLSEIVQQQNSSHFTMTTIKLCHKKRVALWTYEVGTWIHFKVGPALLYAAFHPVIYKARTLWQHSVLNLWIILNVHDVLTFCNTPPRDILTVGLQKIQVFCDPWLTTMMKTLQYFRTFSTSHPKKTA